MKFETKFTLIGLSISVLIIFALGYVASGGMAHP